MDPFGGSHWFLEASGRCPGGSPTSASADGGWRAVLPRGASQATASAHVATGHPFPHLCTSPIRSAPAAPSASPEHVFTGPRMALLRGGHKTGWASPACPLGGGMRAQPPPGGHEVSLQGGRAPRGSKGKKRSETFPATRACRGSCAQPRLCSCAFVNRVGGRGAQPSHDLSEINSFLPTPCWKSFFYFIFFSSMGYKIGLLLLWPTSPALWLT